MEDYQTIRGKEMNKNWTITEDAQGWVYKIGNGEKSFESVELGSNAIIDLDKDGNIIAVEVLKK